MLIIMVKATRPGRAVKCKERWTTDETIVKCKLQTILASREGEERIKFMDTIRSRVWAYSARYHIMSLAMNLYIRERFHGVKSNSLHVVVISEIFDQTFIRQMMLGTSDAQSPIPEVEEFYKRHPDLLNILKSQERHDGDRNIYSAGCRKYLTNLKNHLTVNLHRWMKRWIYSSVIQERLTDVHEFSSPEGRKAVSKALLYDLNGWDLTSDMEENLKKLPSKVKRSLNLQKRILGPKPLERKDANDCMLRYVVFINKFLKKMEPDGRQYNLAPVGGIRCHYMTIDTHVLGGITKELGITEKQEIVREMWDSLFKLKRLEGKSCTFTGTVDTDGCAICVHFKRPKRISDTVVAVSERGYSPVEDTCMVGVDPGRKDILHAAVEISPGVFKSVTLTRNQYYREAGILKHQEKTELWQGDKDVRAALEAMSLVTTKGNSLEKFQEYMDVWKEKFPTLWSEYTKSRWSEGRFRLYGGKKRVFSNYCNKLQSVVQEETKKSRVVVAYGSARFAPTGKGEVAVPTSRAFKECRTRFETHVVPDFRTSMVDHETLTVLQLVGSQKTGKEIRGLRWCCSTIHENRKRMISRDQNAAINIRNILMWGSQRLPEIFKRGEHPLEKKIGRWLLR